MYKIKAYEKLPDGKFQETCDETKAVRFDVTADNETLADYQTKEIAEQAIAILPSID